MPAGGAKCNIEDLPVYNYVDSLLCGGPPRAYSQSVDLHLAKIDNGGINVNMENRGRKTGKPQQDCKCRQCPACVDNARWERIFREKFADPFYYSQKRRGNSSPLADL